MVICHFFLQNRCKFGENCRFEHPRGGAQRSLFNGPVQAWQGGGSQRVTFRDSFGTSGNGSNNFSPSGHGSNSYGTSGHGSNSYGTSGQGGNTFGSTGQGSNSQHKWNANQQSGQRSENSTSQQVSTLDLVNSLPKEMEIWEKSHMWPFSCITVDKDLPSLPEFYDICPEELRFEAYEAMKSGNTQPCIQRYQTLQNEFQNKRRQLQQMTGDLKSKLMALFDEARKKRQTQPSSANSSVFGSAQPAQNLFGQSQPSASSGLFGKSVGATEGSSPGLFGKATSGSTFGGRFSSGSENSGSFGSPGSTLFGKPTGTGSVFGNQPQGQTAQTPNLFGLSNQNSTSNNQGLFGQPANQGQQISSLFGNVTHTTTNQSANLFGSPAASPPQVLFGKPVSGLGQAGTSSFPVGNNVPATQNSVFGASVSQIQPSSTLFGKPLPESTSSPQNLFGSMTPGQGQGIGNIIRHSQGSVSDGTSTASRGLYTPLADLTDQEKEAFNAKSFELGRIPIRPPPRELIN